MKALLALLLFLAALCFTVAAVVNWFQHDDHAAIGFMYLSIVSGNFSAQVILRSRRY